MKKVANSSIISLPIYRNLRHHTPEDSDKKKDLNFEKSEKLLQNKIQLLIQIQADSQYYVVVRICPVRIYGSSTGRAPIHVNRITVCYCSECYLVDGVELRSSEF
jgi:hypothetical protein